MTNVSLTNVQYDAIMRSYDRRQTRRLREMQRRREQAYEAIPALAALDEELSAQRSTLIRALFSDEDSGSGTAAPSSGSGRSGGTGSANERPGKKGSAGPVTEQAGKKGSAGPVTEQAGKKGSVDPTFENSTKAYRSQSLSAVQRRRELLVSAGFPADYLDPVYECPDCQDTGFIRDPDSPGTIHRCHCFHQAVIDLLYTQSGLKEILEKENFSTFSLDYYSSELKDPATGKTSRQNMEDILAYCKNALSCFDQIPANLFFYGDTGLGKTFLTHCIARELLESSHSVMYYSAFSLFEWLAQITFGKETADREDPGVLSHIRYLYECDYLIIDDLGTELTNSFVSSRLFAILNERAARKKGTLISTNLSLPGFAQTYSERIFSRITSGYRLLHFFGNDIRIQKKLSRRTTNGTVKSSHQKS